MDLQSHIVLISSRDSGNHFFGTGFIFYRDQEGTYVLTCAHVVKDVGGEDNVAVSSFPAKIVAYGGQIHDSKEAGLDLAVLRVDDSLGKSGLTLRLAGKKGDRVTVSGFRHHGIGQHLLKPLDGVLGEPVALEYTGSPDRFRAWELITSDEDPLQKGYSGSPVVDQASGCVLGVASHIESQTKGLIISVEGLPRIWQGMPPTLLELLRSTIPPFRIQLEDPRMNLEIELDAFEKVINGSDKETRLFLIHGASGMGKSYLFKLYKSLAAANGIEIIEFGLGAQISVEQCMDQIVANYGFERFPRYDEFKSAGRPDFLTLSKEAEWQANLTRKFLIDIGQCPGIKNLLVLFDQFEKVDQKFKHWVCNDFLPFLSSRIPIIVTLAGQEVIERLPSRKIYKNFHLSGVRWQDYANYAAEKKVPLKTEEIKLLHEALNGQPKRFTELIASRSRANGA
jgi:hypothetical protein